jgi:NAD+ kinase
MAFYSAGLFGRYQDHAVEETILSLQSFLQSRGLRVFLGDTTSSEIAGIRVEESGQSLPETIDVGIVVGGDGTMLHVARTLADFDLPLIGINLGRLGFLTDIPAENMEQKLDDILRGEFILERRIMLSANVTKKDEVIAECTALNDIFLSKGDTGRLIEFETRVGNQSVARTRSDGIIVATPTGSTGYALSAGGPILHPLLPAIVFAPICPHTLGQRPLVLDDQSQIDIEIVDLAGAPANFFVDGLRILSLTGDEHIQIQRSKKITQLVRSKTHNHYSTLSSKLGWG